MTQPSLIIKRWLDTCNVWDTKETPGYTSWGPQGVRDTGKKNGKWWAPRNWTHATRLWFYVLLPSPIPPPQPYIQYLYWHSPEVWAQEEKPHELIGVDGHQVADLPSSHFPHGQVGGGQVHNFIINLGLEARAECFTFIIITILFTSSDAAILECARVPHAALEQYTCVPILVLQMRHLKAQRGKGLSYRSSKSGKEEWKEDAGASFQ